MNVYEESLFRILEALNFQSTKLNMYVLVFLSLCSYYGASCHAIQYMPFIPLET